MSLIAELRRRNVFRVGAAYAIVGWLLIQVAATVLPTFEAPEWVLRVFTFVVILSFPLALVFAWAFELTPEGIRREKDVEPGASIRRLTGRRLDFAIIGLLALAVLFLVVDHYVLEAEPGPSQVVAEQSPATSPALREKSVAVLPFDNISPDPDDAYFADGMHDEVLTQLSKIRDLKVISRTSVMRYRGEGRPSSPEIAAALGVAHILEGSVRLAAGRVRITVQLIDAKTDSHLWAETYDRALTAANVFSIQGTVAHAVADALRATLAPEERELLDRIPTGSLAALEAYFRGKQHLAKRTTAALAEAVDDFSRAIELDPNFALAYVGLADSYQLQEEYSGLPLAEALAKAQAAVDKALALDGRLAEAHTSLGGIRLRRSDFAGAEAAFTHSLELNSNYATAHHWHSVLLGSVLGRRDEALESVKKAADLDPRAPIILSAMGGAYERLGRFAEGLTWLRRAIEIDPDFAVGHYFLGIHYWYTDGRYDEAIRSMQRSVSLDPRGADNLSYYAWLLLDLGDLDRAEYWSERAIELAPESALPNLTMHLVQLYRGDLRAAREYGERATDVRRWWFFLFSEFDPMRVDAMRAGRWPEARAAFEAIAPELLARGSPEVGRRNYRAAIDLALILSELGERGRTESLLENSLQYIRQIPRLGFEGYGIADVQIYTLRGDEEKALAALRQAVDDGWRQSWWYFVRYDPILKALHDEPEFKAIVAELETDMAERRARVEEMERRGELTLTAELPAQGDHALSQPPTNQR